MKFTQKVYLLCIFAWCKSMLAMHPLELKVDKKLSLLDALRTGKVTRIEKNKEKNVDIGYIRFPHFHNDLLKQPLSYTSSFSTVMKYIDDAYHQLENVNWADEILSGKLTHEFKHENIRLAFFGIFIFNEDLKSSLHDVKNEKIKLEQELAHEKCISGEKGEIWVKQEVAEYETIIKLCEERAEGYNKWKTKLCPSDSNYYPVKPDNVYHDGLRIIQYNRKLLFKAIEDKDAVQFFKAIKKPVQLVQVMDTENPLKDLLKDL